MGVWNESGLVDTIPPDGLPLVWRTPVRGGYSGPTVAAGRVFLTDYADGVERLAAFDESTGRQLWQHTWKADYRGIEYATGPRAAPTVDGDFVYALGATGRLSCVRTSDGQLLWSRSFPEDFQARIPLWGTTAAPLVHGDKLIVVAAGRPDAKVVALDKRTGAEVWRSLESEGSEPGYSQPVIFAGRLVVFHAGGVAVLNPDTGAVHWEHPWRITFNTPIATPVNSGPFLLVSAFFQGARLFRLDSGELLWRGKSDSETNTDTIHALMNSPLIEGEYIYGFCNYGQLRCLRLATGERVWESQQATVEKARNVSAFLVRARDRCVIFNDRGELIFARLSPDGYSEMSRTRLIRPTSPAGSRREAKAVVWAHPAFANGHVIVRNDEEMIRYDARR